jgi:hypothetical protein
MRNAAMRLERVRMRLALIARIRTQVLAAALRRLLFRDLDHLQYLCQPLTVVEVGSSHGERQRDATTVCQQMPLAAFFPRSSVGFANAFLCQRRFHHRTIDTLPAPGNPGQLIPFGQPRPPQRFIKACRLTFQKPLMDGSGIAKPFLGQGFLSIGSLRAKHTRCLQIPAAWVSGDAWRLALGLRLYSLAGNTLADINGSTRRQNPSDTSHDANRFAKIDLLILS